MVIPEDLIDWTPVTSEFQRAYFEKKNAFSEATNRGQELEVPPEIFSSGISSTAIRTYFALRWVASGKKSLQITLDKLSLLCQSSSETQRRALRELENANFIETVREPHPIRAVRINTYSFLDKSLQTSNATLNLRAPNEYFDTTIKLSSSQFLLAMILYREAKRRLDVKIRMSILEKMTGSNRSSINSNLKVLQSFKLIYVERLKRNRGYLHENRYYLRAAIDNEHRDRLVANKKAKRNAFSASGPTSPNNAEASAAVKGTSDWVLQQNSYSNPATQNTEPGDFNPKVTWETVVSEIPSIQLHSL